jgi:hypothetical protein
MAKGRDAQKELSKTIRYVPAIEHSVTSAVGRSRL